MRMFSVHVMPVLALLAAGLTSALATARLEFLRAGEDWVLIWPATNPPLVLEQANDPRAAAPWVRVPRDEYEAFGGEVRHRIVFTGTRRFFRLREERPPPPARPHGLVAAWRMDERDGFHALPDAEVEVPLVIACAAWAAGRIGPGALAFNGRAADAGGSRAFVSNAGRHLLPTADGALSVSLWFNAEALDDTPRLLLGMDGADEESWHLSLRSPGPAASELVLAVHGQTNYWPLTGETPLLLPGQWHQLTLVADGATTCAYVDAARVGCATTAIHATAGSLWLGGGMAGRASFHGRLDELRLYTAALTAEQVALTGEWRFDEGEGDVAEDTSLLGHPATGVSANAWANGKHNGALHLAAGPVRISNAHAEVIPAGGAPFSLSCWVRPRAHTPGRARLLGCAGDPLGGWELAIETTDLAGTWLRWIATNGGTLDLAAPLPLPLESWTKLDVTYDGGIASLYANGVFVAAQPGAIRGSHAPLMLGAEAPAVAFDGWLDELRVYRRERRAAEIGPVASNVWETVLLNTTTNLALAGGGPVGRPLIYTVSADPPLTRGELTPVGNGPLVTYAAGAAKGPEQFTYTVSDGEFTSPPATVTISVVQPHWLSPEGGSARVLDGRSPASAWRAGTADALDAIWRTNNYYDAFFYAPGVYETRGYKYLERRTANPGCKHYGSGADGPEATTLRLVDSWQAWRDGIIFADLTLTQTTDGFELHHLRLDCNAAHNTKLLRGEPVWLRLPLTSTTRVDTVTLHWTGRAAEYRLCTRTPVAGAWVTNCLSFTNTALTETRTVGAVTDEITVYLDRRAPGVSLYGLREIEVAGGELSLPRATTLDGQASRLDATRGIGAALDGSTSTVWASGPEAQARLDFPLAANTAVDRINLHWNCQTLANVGWLGPAAEFVVLAHSDATGGFAPVVFTRHGRGADGMEIVTFGPPGATNRVLTRQLALLLTAREPGVASYSLREITFHRGSSTVVPRIPTALSRADASRSVLRAVDGDVNTVWSSGTQGALTAVHLRGSQVKLRHLKIVGFATTPLRECFPLFFFVPRSMPFVTDVLIEDCVVTDPAGWSADGVTAVTMVGDGNGRLRNAVARRVTVSGLRSRFSYSQGFTAAHVEDCRVEDCGVGVYFEPNATGLQSVGPVVVRGNQFHGVNHGVRALMLPGAVFDSILMRDNSITMATSGASGWAFSACDTCINGPSGTVTNVVAIGNRIHYPGWQPHPARTDGGFHYSDIQHAVFGRNLVALGTASGLRVRQYPSGRIPFVAVEDCDHPYTGPPGVDTFAPSLDALPPGYRRAWFENRALDGALLPVRHRRQGADRDAAQQQWP